MPEIHSDHAATLLAGGTALLAPGYWSAEVATALWAMSAIHAAMTRTQAIERMAWIAGLMVEVVPMDRLIAAALGISFDLHATTCDTLYLALAERSGTALVTADRGLYDKAKATDRFTDLIVWVGDLSSDAAA